MNSRLRTLAVRPAYDLRSHSVQRPTNFITHITDVEQLLNQNHASATSHVLRRHPWVVHNRSLIIQSAQLIVTLTLDVDDIASLIL